MIAREQVKREACWTEGLGVGSAGFVESIRGVLLSRQETDLVQPDPELWVLQEAPVPYVAKTGAKNAANRLNWPRNCAMPLVQRNLFWRQETNYFRPIDAEALLAMESIWPPGW